MGGSYQENILHLNELMVHILPRSFIYKKDLANSQLWSGCVWLPNVCKCIIKLHFTVMVAVSGALELYYTIFQTPSCYTELGACDRCQESEDISFKERPLLCLHGLPFYLIGCHLFILLPFSRVIRLKLQDIKIVALLTVFLIDWVFSFHRLFIKIILCDHVLRGKYSTLTMHGPQS